MADEYPKTANKEQDKALGELAKGEHETPEIFKSNHEATQKALNEGKN